MINTSDSVIKLKAQTANLRPAGYYLISMFLGAVSGKLEKRGMDWVAGWFSQEEWRRMTSEVQFTMASDRLMLYVEFRRGKFCLIAEWRTLIGRDRRVTVL